METQYQEKVVRWSGTVTMPKRLVQAYRQAPWRIETQRGALFLIVAILGASILWVMVSVTVQAASAGLRLQELEEKQEILTRQIAGLRTEIAVLTSAARMQERAQAMQFEPVSPEDLTYVVIEGYSGREPILKAPPPGRKVEQPLIKPAYTQSLWEWMLQGILEINGQSGGRIP